MILTLGELVSAQKREKQIVSPFFFEDLFGFAGRFNPKVAILLRWYPP